MAGSAGRSCVDDDVRVIKVYEDRVAEPDDLAVTDGSEVGEVIIRSNAKSAAFYFGNPAETRRRFHDGFFYTNDLGTWDENHYFHIVGRKDDMIISGGENIYPVEVEEVLNLHPGSQGLHCYGSTGQQAWRDRHRLCDRCRPVADSTGTGTLLQGKPAAGEL